MRLQFLRFQNPFFSVGPFLSTQINAIIVCFLALKGNNNIQPGAPSASSTGNQDSFGVGSQPKKPQTAFTGTGGVQPSPETTLTPPWEATAVFPLTRTLPTD